MKITKGKLNGIYKISSPENHVDERGFMLRIFDDRLFQEQGIRMKWLQQSLSYTTKKNVVRGINVQLSPFTEGKLITILSGEVFWVALDLRRNSPTFAKWESVILSKNDTCALLVERGFGHGCFSLADNCNLLLNSDNFHSCQQSKGILWDDPDLAIDWPLKGAVPIISDTHRFYPSFKSFVTNYGGI